ncbi:hypothetical protein ACOSQ3_024165 [Xanthoceras sorbifolium]
MMMIEVRGFLLVQWVAGWALQTQPLQCQIGTRSLVVLDDEWSLSVLDQLIFKVLGCKTLVVSRFEFQAVLNANYKVELLRENESMLLFCHSAFIF